MARLMLSAGIFSALAATMAPRRRGLESGSPPPFFAAILISRMSLVKILPRLASSAPFLCLIVAHFECPDIGGSFSADARHEGRVSGSKRRSKYEANSGCYHKPVAVGHEADASTAQPTWRRHDRDQGAT